VLNGGRAHADSPSVSNHDFFGGPPAAQAGPSRFDSPPVGGTPTRTAAPGNSAAPAPMQAPPTSERLAAAKSHTRWKKSQTSFGPVGRIVITVLVLIPVPFAIAIAVMAFPGAALYLIVPPWVLRDTWRKVRRR
jgi:hypothetical protein